MPDVEFLIIGAQKAGTTSLFEYMRRHPEIHMPPEKEISFFNRHYEMGAHWYTNTVLKNASPEAVCGEASVGYMAGTPYADITHNETLARATDGSGPQTDRSHPEPLEGVIPHRIKSLLPRVKLICVLRDPVARAYSHYQMSVLDGSEPRSFGTAVNDLLDSSALLHARIAPTRINGYIVNGEYQRVLAGFLEIFPREQLLVIFSNELSTDAASTLSRVFDFVDVTADFVPGNLNERYRAAATRQRVPGFDLYAWQRSVARSRRLRTLWHRLPASVRLQIDRGYRIAGYRVAMWNALRGEGRQTTQSMSADTRAKLIAHFLPDSQALGRLTGLAIPWLADWAES